MVDRYNLTSTENVTSVFDLMTGVNSITSNLFGTVFLITAYFIIFFSMKQWQNLDAWAATNFGITVLAFMFFAAGMIGETVLFFFTILSVFSIMWLIIR